MRSVHPVEILCTEPRTKDCFNSQSFSLHANVLPIPLITYKTTQVPLILVSSSPMLFSVSVPAANPRGPQYMEQVLAAIHQANPRRRPITFIIAPHAKKRPPPLSRPDTT